ncbi:MAG: VCBS repeat-containing protein, partial [bacterium]
MDYDADGDLDILSGSYTGELYLFERNAGGGFDQGRYLLDDQGQELKAKSSSVTVEAIDIDADDDLDLVLGTRSGAVEIFDNVGSRSSPSYAGKSRPLLTADGDKVKGSNAHHADWDGDGILDLVLGSEYGGVNWYRNLGSNNAPKYAASEPLIEKGQFQQRQEADGPDGAGSRTKVFVTDWNLDGLPDLLVGDVQWLYYTLPPLTAEQEAEKLALTPAYEAADAILDKAYEYRNSFVGKP